MAFSQSLCPQLKPLSYEKVVLAIFFPLLFFTPAIHITGFPFYFDISDFLLLLIVPAIIKNNWWRTHLKPIAIFGVIASYILLTILINRQASSLNNYFEIYDLFKLLFLFIFFEEMRRQTDIMPILNACFIGLVCFNIFHYYNLFDFNTRVMPLYCGHNSVHLQYFGYNSLGMPATKRALGILGNPNNNAILFLFFTILYAPHKEWKRLHQFFFFLALTVFLCCQSRTGLVALVAMLVANYIFAGIPWKKVVIQSFCIAAFSWVVLNFSEILLFLHIPLPTRPMNYSLSLLDGSALRSNSWEERKNVWQHLLSMSKEHPIFGHGPNKNYFYENHIYAENEYILMLWRYGIIGMLMYISLYLYPVWKSFSKLRNSMAARRILMIAIVFAITALTNAPFSSVKLSILLIFIYSLYPSSTNVSSDTLTQS